MNTGKPSFERNGQRRLLTREDFAAGQFRRCPEKYRKPLEDDDPFPFGKPKRDGLTMCQVEAKYWRWFLQQDWRDKWPRVRDYFLKKLGAQEADPDRVVLRMVRDDEVKLIRAGDLPKARK